MPSNPLHMRVCPNPAKWTTAEPKQLDLLLIVMQLNPGDCLHQLENMAAQYRKLT